MAIRRHSKLGVGCLLLGMLVFAGAPVFAQTPERRPPDEAERLYREVGGQLFCICGCREGLLGCTMNNCDAKQAERAYLHELSEDPSLDAVGIKSAMVERFGEKVLQVPTDSNLYTILGIAGVLLVAGFGFGFRAVTRRRADAQPEQDEKPSGGPVDPEMESRINRELKELD